MNDTQCNRHLHSARLRIVIIAAVVSMVGASVYGADTVLDNRGDSAFFALTARPLASFPAFESVVPMPRNINPFNRKRVRQSCVVRASKRTNPVKGAKGTFTVELVIMDNSKGTFVVIDLPSGKFKTDSQGQAVFGHTIATDLFAQGFKSGEISAWSYTRVEFAKRKGTYAFLDCRVTARK